MKQPELKNYPIEILKTDHEFYNLFEVTIGEFFLENMKRRGQSVRPLCVVEDGNHYVLSDKKHVITAKLAELKEMEVFEYDSLSKTEIIRHICDHTSEMKIKGYHQQFQIIKYLYDFLGRPEGRDLYDSLAGEDKKDKVAKVLGISETSVQNLYDVGTVLQDEDDYFTKLQNRNGITWQEALDDLKSVRNQREKESRTKGVDVELIISAVRVMCEQYIEGKITTPAFIIRHEGKVIGATRKVKNCLIRLEFVGNNEVNIDPE